MAKKKKDTRNAKTKKPAPKKPAPKKPAPKKQAPKKQSGKKQTAPAKKKIVKASPRPKNKTRAPQKKIAQRKSKPSPQRPRAKSKPRAKTKIGTALPYIREPDSSQFVIFRDRKGRPRKSPRASLKLVAEVRDRKTKKVVGYANRIFGGKPVPRRFSGRTKRFLSARRVESAWDAIAEQKFAFKLITSETILDQIKDQSFEAIEAIKDKATEDKYCRFLVTMTTSSSESFTKTLFVRADVSKNDIGYFIGSSIITSLKDAQVRMSPKPVADNPEHKHERSINCEVEIFEN